MELLQREAIILDSDKVGAVCERFCPKIRGTGPLKLTKDCPSRELVGTAQKQSQVPYKAFGFLLVLTWYCIYDTGDYMLNVALTDVQPQILNCIDGT